MIARIGRYFYFVNRILNLPLVSFFWPPSWIYKQTFDFLLGLLQLVKIRWRHIWRHSHRHFAFSISVFNNYLSHLNNKITIQALYITMLDERT